MNLKKYNFMHSVIHERVEAMMNSFSEEDLKNYVYDKLYEEFREELTYIFREESDD